MDLSIILPCKNESPAIDFVLPDLLQKKQMIKDQLGLSAIEIIIINDNSTDNSANKLLKYSDQISIVTSNKNLGYGGALKKGVAKAQGDYIAFFDLDKTHDPLDLINMFQALQKNQAIMAVGVRLTKSSHMPTVRRAGNIFYAKLISMIYNHKLKDSTSGMRLIKRQNLMELNSQMPNSLDYSLALTLKCIRQKHKMIETPITYNDRSGESKLNPFKDGLLFLKTIIVYRFNY